VPYNPHPQPLMRPSSAGTLNTQEIKESYDRARSSKPKPVDVEKLTPEERQELWAMADCPYMRDCLYPLQCRLGDRLPVLINPHLLKRGWWIGKVGAIDLEAQTVKFSFPGKIVCVGLCVGLCSCVCTCICCSTSAYLIFFLSTTCCDTCMLVPGHLQSIAVQVQVSSDIWGLLSALVKFSGVLFADNVKWRDETFPPVSRRLFRGNWHDRSK